ncbi:MAG: FGGY-family carbohydrate kinase [Sphaerochaetaceae bacterium]
MMHTVGSLGMEYFLGLDNGGTMCKAVVFDKYGHAVCKKSEKLRMLTPAPKCTERDMEELWKANIKVLHDVVEGSGVDPSQIKALACSGHGKGLYLWGKDNRPVRNGIVSTDGRASEWKRRWEQDGTARKVFETNYQGIMSCQPVCLLRWLKENEPENYRNIRWIFEVKDYIRFRLTGKARAEVTDYSGSNLMDLSRKAFTRENLALFGIEEMYDALPPIAMSVEICGAITTEVARCTGLREGMPVAGGMFDIDACSIGMDIVQNNFLCVIAGTWGINQYISRTPVLDHSVEMNSFYCYGDYYLIEESSATSAGNLEWYIRMFLGKEAMEAKARNRNIYQICDELVSSVRPEDDEIVFLPYIFGSNYNPNAKACLIGMDSHHTQAHMLRAVFEGIVFCHKVHIEKLWRNNSFKAVRMAGGATNSVIWTQMFADIIGLPIEIVECDEIGALGCAMAAAVASGTYADLREAGGAMSRIKRIVEPDAAMKAVYARKYQRYKEISHALDAYWG